MKKQQINDHTIAFIFDEISGFETAVFLIDKPNRYYLIDTFCGANPMSAILSHIETLEVKKRLVVINTHFHWDHMWGNCLFKNRDIISHASCRTLIEDTWDQQIESSGKYIMGNNEMTLPNLVFQQSLMFEDDGIELLYSPGHTSDSISIYDREQATLFVGDNLEKPLLFIEDKDINRYLRTLEKYIDYQPEAIVASHSIGMSFEDLEDAIEYLKKISTGQKVSFEEPTKQAIHEKNKSF
nr:MBL fold metallo-hydrolase [Vallitaleaceae bacterium]